MRHNTRLRNIQWNLTWEIEDATASITRTKISHWYIWTALGLLSEECSQELTSLYNFGRHLPMLRSTWPNSILRRASSSFSSTVGGADTNFVHMAFNKLFNVQKNMNGYFCYNFEEITEKNKIMKSITNHVNAFPTGDSVKSVKDVWAFR